MQKISDDIFLKRIKIGLIIGSIILLLGIASLIWGPKEKNWIGIFMVVYGVIRVSMSLYFMQKTKKNKT